MRFILLSILLTSCALQNPSISPTICYLPQERVISNLPGTFPTLSRDELQTGWGQEIAIGISFGKEVDLYRSITAFKRAKILIPPHHPRLQQIDYSLILAYYMGNKYYDAIQIFEEGSCSNIDQSFPGLKTLLTVLYDCYTKTNQIEKASCILDIIHMTDPEDVAKLQTGTAIELGSFEEIYAIKKDPCLQASIDEFLTVYNANKKSPKKAQILNALLPGAGYLYLDQPKTAMTAVVVNAIFIAATYQLFHKGYYAPALFTLSLESGWYLGGINGAALAAKEYNESLYNILGKETMLKERLFPVLRIEHAF